MVNFQHTLLDPIYAIYGVSVVLSLADGREFDTLKAIDKTAGVDVAGDSGLAVPTIKPVAAFRVKELHAADILFKELPDAELEMNGFTWNVENYIPKPNAHGENTGEVFLVLSNKNERRA